MVLHGFISYMIKALSIQKHSLRNGQHMYLRVNPEDTVYALAGTLLISITLKTGYHFRLLQLIPETSLLRTVHSQVVLTEADA